MISIAAILLCIDVFSEAMQSGDEDIAEAGLFGMAAGSYLAEKRPMGNVLFIVRPRRISDLGTEEMINKFKRNYGTSNVMVAELDPPLADEQVFTFAARDFDSLIGAVPDADVIVNTVGLPRDAKAMKLWNMSETQHPLMLVKGDLRCSTADLLSLLKRDGFLAVAVERRTTSDETEDQGKPLNKDGLPDRNIIVDRHNLPDHIGDLRR